MRVAQQPPRTVSFILHPRHVPRWLSEVAGVVVDICTCTLRVSECLPVCHPSQSRGQRVGRDLNGEQQHVELAPDIIVVVWGNQTRRT